MQMSGFGWTVKGGMRKKCSLAFGSLSRDDEGERVSLGKFSEIVL